MTEIATVPGADGLTRPRHPDTAAPPAGAVMCHVLSDHDAQSARELAGRCAREFVTVSDQRFQAQAAVIAAELPGPVRRAANEARLHDKLHAFIIGNNPIGASDLEKTPSHWKEADTEGSRPAAFLLMIYAALLGDVIGWASQQDGRLVTDVLPIKGYEDSLLSSSSHKALGWHTEDAFSPCRADYVGLLCLRNPSDTATSLSYLDTSALGAETLDVLHQRRFRTLPDGSHSIPGAGELHAAVPVLSGAPEAPVLRIDRDYTGAIPGDEEAAEALKRAVGHLDRNLYPLVLRPGYVCFLDNRNVVHGRQRFFPRYDGYDRWLKRVNVVVDLRATRSGRASSSTRVIG